MRIKGKLLLKEGLLKTKVGELVYIAQSSIAVYNDGLYLNISDVFFREKIGSFTLPIIRVGSGNEDFEIDMKDTLLIYTLTIDEPQKKYGWIGPFSFEFEYYTKEKIWNRLNCVDLLNSLYQTKLDGKDEDALSIRDIRRQKFIVEVKSFSEIKINEEKKITDKYLDDIINVLKEMEESGGYSSVELSAQKFLISETEVDVSTLDDEISKFEEKRDAALFDELTLAELESKLSSMDLESEDANYELAIKYKNRIAELKVIVIDK